MPDQDSAIARALDAFQPLLKSKHTINPTSDRELIAAARVELLQMRASRSKGRAEARHRPATSERVFDQ